MHKSKKKLDVLRFIELYRSQEVLWNTHLPSYRRNDLKLAAYELIGTEMKMTVEDVKKKIKSLRTAYRAEKMKIDKSEKSGHSTDPLYTPTVIWYDKMSFLDPALIDRNSVDISNNHSSMKKKEFIKKKRQLLQPDDNHHPQNSPQKTHKDEADIYGQSWAVTYRKLQPDQKIFAKRLMEEILMYGQLGHLSLSTSINIDVEHDSHIYHSSELQYESTHSHSPAASSTYSEI